jgi:hypothetical protein
MRIVSRHEETPDPTRKPQEVRPTGIAAAWWQGCTMITGELFRFRFEDVKVPELTGLIL